MKRKKNSKPTFTRPQPVPTDHEIKARYPEIAHWTHHYTAAIDRDCDPVYQKELAESIVANISHPMITCWLRKKEILLEKDLLIAFDHTLNTLLLKKSYSKSMLLAVLKAILNSNFDVPRNLCAKQYRAYNKKALLTLIETELDLLKNPLTFLGAVPSSDTLANEEEEEDEDDDLSDKF